MSTNDPRLVRLAEPDNVLILAKNLSANEMVKVSGVDIVPKYALSLGHKIAARDIAKGETVLKYNFPIGIATADIALGDHVHIHNVRSDYTPTYVVPDEDKC